MGLILCYFWDILTCFVFFFGLRYVRFFLSFLYLFYLSSINLLVFIILLFLIDKAWKENTECIYSFEIQPKLNENHQRKSIESLEATYTDSLYTQKGILVVKDIRPFRPALVQVKNMCDLEPENYISSLSEVYCVA